MTFHDLDLYDGQLVIGLMDLRELLKLQSGIGPFVTLGFALQRLGSVSGCALVSETVSRLLTGPNEPVGRMVR